MVGLVILLFGLQLAALAGQLRRGFRPFGAPPVRVPLSWDMFATRIERCTMGFQPAFPIAPGKELSNLTEAGEPIEWFPVFDRLETYRLVARASCKQARPGTRIYLRCWLPDGTRPAFVHRCS